MMTLTRRVPYRARAMAAAIIATVFVALPGPSSADTKHYRPGPNDQLYRSPAVTYQFGSSPGQYGINGLVFELSPPILLPIISHYTAHHKAYGYWYCYGTCGHGGTYVTQTFDAGTIFTHDTWWLGQLLQYYASMEVTWEDNPMRATNPPPGFIGPVNYVHSYEQGVTDTHPVLYYSQCEPFISNPTYTMHCLGGGGVFGYHHAPLFHVETAVSGADPTSYIAWGSGGFDWGWDGI